MNAMNFGDAEGYAAVGGPFVRITLGRHETILSASEAEAFAHVLLAEVAQARALSEPRERNEDDCGVDFESREVA
jgi:hypothetical protein